jgi:hypothetical protein
MSNEMGFPVKNKKEVNNHLAAPSGNTETTDQQKTLSVDEAARLIGVHFDWDEMERRVELMEKYLALSQRIESEGSTVNEADITRLEEFLELSGQVKHEGSGVDDDDIERLENFLELSERIKHEGSTVNDDDIERLENFLDLSAKVKEEGAA